MKVRPASEQDLTKCAEFWHRLHRGLPYVQRPDGYQNVNGPSIGPDYFLKYLADGLGNESRDHWHGEVTYDGILVAESAGELEGLVVTSVDRDRGEAAIVSAYVPPGSAGYEAAGPLLDAALDRFRALGLSRATAGPDVTKCLPADSPFHLALLRAGFAWQDDWEPPPDDAGATLVRSEPGYSVVLGGSLEGFRVTPEVSRTRERLQEAGVRVERLPAQDAAAVQRLDTGMPIGPLEGEVTYVATVGDRAVGWLWEVQTHTDWAEGPDARVMGGAVPEVIPAYRRRGIGKVLYHLGIEEVVRQGAVAGWTVTGVRNPARLIYASVGYRYWYLAYNLLSRRV